MLIFNESLSLPRNFLAFTTEDTLNKSNIKYVAKIVKLLENKNISISDRLFSKLFYIDNKDIKILFKKLKEYYKIKNGIYLNSTFAKSENIEDDNLTIEDYFNILYSYTMVYGLNLPFTLHKNKIASKELDKNIYKPSVNKIIDYKDLDQLESYIENIINLPIVFGKNEQEIIEAYIDFNLDSFKKIINRSNIKVKENTIFIISKIGIIQGIDLLNTANDILRYILFNNGYDYTSFKYNKDIKFKIKTYKKKLILKKLDILAKNNFNETFGEMNKKRGYWLKFVRNVHPLSRKYSKLNSMQKLFKSLIDNDKSIKYYERVEAQLIKNRDIEQLIDHLSLKPGILLQKIDFIIRNSSDEEIEYLCKKLLNIDLNNRLLITTIPYLKFRKENSIEKRIIKVKKIFTTVEKPLPKLPSEKVKPVIAVLKEKLFNNIKNRDIIHSNKIVYIDKELKNYKIPSQLRDVSKTIDGIKYTPGSIIDIENSSKYIRIFTAWGNKNVENSNFDIDLSAIIVDKNDEIRFTAFFDYSEDYIKHSGDFVSTFKWDEKKVVAEYIDIDIEKVKKAGFKYITITNNIYSNGDDLELSWDKDIKAISGIQLLNKRLVSKNSINITRSEFGIELQGDSELNIPFIYDVENNRIIVIDYYKKVGIYKNAGDFYYDANIIIDKYIKLSGFQTDFYTIIKEYCKLNNIEITRKYDENCKNCLKVDKLYISNNLDKLVNSILK